MTIKYDFINCKDKSFNDIEYQALRNEQNKRVDMAYNHGYLLAGIILVFFAAIFAFCKDLFDIASNADSIIGKSAIIDSLITCVVIFFCGIPSLIVYPYSVKYHDNIRQIVSIATYLRVFYEYPSIIKNIEKEEEKDKFKVNGWELIHCSHNIPRGNFLAIELYVITIASIILATLFGIALFSCMIGSKFFFDNAPYIENSFSIPIIIFFIVLAFAYLIFLIITANRCHKNVKIETLFETYGEIYFNEYLKEAQELNLYDEHEAKELKDYMQKMNVRDILILQELKKRKI